MKKLLLTLPLLALAATAALAGPQEDREALMKERAGLLKQITPYAKGDSAFDATAVQALLVKLDQNAKRDSVDELFPEGSQAGSEASPKIWEDKNAFKAEWTRYADATSAAVAAAPKDQASLQMAVGAIGKECGVCHQNFRVKK
ncbi:MAG: cytochrome c [Methylobacterium mesophilicum]|nr:cytochrome c [Methylobacterium mesophilicum]